jgi:thiol-disulfide isomerase/thioredoxin
MVHAQKKPPGLLAAGLCAAIFLAALALAGAAAAGPGERSFAEDLQGRAVDPLAASPGRVVVLLFVRTDCPISNRYAPAVQKLSEKYRGRANFWLVYPDSRESAPEIESHLEQFHYAIPALRDIRHELVRRAAATITPEAAVFDGARKLVYHGRIDNWYEDLGRARSLATTHELDDAVTAALEGRAMVPEHADAVGCYISDVK